MGMNFDSMDIDLPCPKCGKKLKEKLGRLKRDQHITCPKCGRLAVETDQLRSIEARLKQTVAQELEKIGRKTISINFKL